MHTRPVLPIALMVVAALVAGCELAKTNSFEEVSPDDGVAAPGAPSATFSDTFVNGPKPSLPTISDGRWRLPPAQSTIETYELQIPSETMQLFAQDVYTPEQPATFVYNGQSFPVSVRLRGASARTFPKKSWNVDFNDLRFFGREELNLVAEYQDQTMMVEKLGYDMLQAMGVLAPSTKYVRVTVNGVYQGVFLDIEEVDKKFLRAHQAPDVGANIYRCGGWDCEMKQWRQPWQGVWERATNRDAPANGELDALLAVINETPEPDFAAVLEQTIDVEAFLKLMAFEAVISNNFVEDARSFWVADRVTGRWYYVPWDLNNADPRWWPTYGLDMEPLTQHPLYSYTLQDPWLQNMYAMRSVQVEGYEPTFDHLRTRILLNPELRERLFALTERARTELLDPAELHARIDAVHAFLTPHMQSDPYMILEAFELGLPYMKRFVTDRNAFVLNELARLRAQKPGLMIDAFNPAAGWIELRNRSDQALSTEGMVVTTYLRKAVVPSNVPGKTLLPGEALRLTATELGVSFAPRGQVGLFNGKSVAGVIDALFYGPLSAGHYARHPNTAAWEYAR